MSWAHDVHRIKDPFHALLAAGLMPKPTKARFGRAEMEYLGSSISREGSKIGDDRIQVIADFPQPTTIKEIPPVLGTVNVVRKYTPRFGDFVDPLVAHELRICTTPFFAHVLDGGAHTSFRCHHQAPPCYPSGISLISTKHFIVHADGETWLRVQ